MPAKSANELGLSHVPGEPQFLLLARDPLFAPLIEQWVSAREADIRCGARPASDIAQVTNAKVILADGAQWRLKNNGVWRSKPGDISEVHKDGTTYYGLTGSNTDAPPQTVTTHYGHGSSATGTAPKLSPEEQAKASATVQVPSPRAEAIAEGASSQAAIDTLSAKMNVPAPLAFGHGSGKGQSVVDTLIHVQPEKPRQHIQSPWLAPTGKGVELPPIPSAVYKAIEEAATKVSTPLSIMLAFAHIESGFAPDAHSRAGTAAGLYQFTHDTWTEMVNSFGAQYKITPDMVYDPLSNAIMAAERIKKYGQYLGLHRLPLDAGNMYCLHFLGMTGGAKLIMCALGKSAAYGPNTIASVVFPIAAAANPNMFGKRTLLELYTALHDKAQNLADAYQTQPVTVTAEVA